MFDKAIDKNIYLEYTSIRNKKTRPQTVLAHLGRVSYMNTIEMLLRSTTILCNFVLKVKRFAKKSIISKFIKLNLLYYRGYQLYHEN